MGFMDKAKKLAEQAQEKLDEAQKNFNQSASPQAPAGESARYDEHGRPIKDEETPAAETPAEAPAAETPPPAAQPPSGGANASPDPFKPIE